MKPREKRRWQFAVAGSIGIHLLFFALLGLFASMATKPNEPIYVEVTMAELFSPVEEPPGAAAASAVPEQKKAEPKPVPSEPAMSETVTAAQPTVSTQVTPAQTGSAIGTKSLTPAGGSGTAGVGKGGGASRGPRIINGEKPEYPEQAREKGLEGTVRLQILVNVRGQVESVQTVASSGYAELDRTAEQAVRAWRFSPALKNGIPVAAWATVPIVFDLR